MKYGDGITVIIYDFFSKGIEDITESRVTSKVIYHKLSSTDNEEDFKEKHGCFVSGLVCDQIYGVAKNSKIELMDMNNFNDGDDSEFFINNLWKDTTINNSLEFFTHAIDVYNKNIKQINSILFDKMWSKFTGSIVNCSFGINFKSFCKSWNNLNPKSAHDNIFYLVKYLYEFLYLMSKGKAVVHAAGNESLVFSGCNLFIEKSICNDEHYRRYYLWVANIMLDGVHIHFSSNQPGTNSYMYTRTICAPGAYVKSLHCFKDSEEVLSYSDEHDNLQDLYKHFNIQEQEIIKRFNITNDKDSSFTIGTGTSFSSPLVTGILAVLQSNFPNKDIRDILDAVLYTAHPIIIQSKETRNNPIIRRDIISKDIDKYYPPEIVNLSRSVYGMGSISLLNSYNYLAKLR
jgi:hypothetical protein